MSLRAGCQLISPAERGHKSWEVLHENKDLGKLLDIELHAKGKKASCVC